jgi:Cu+-exporting ATPase
MAGPSELGNVALMEQLEVDADPLVARADDLRADGQGVMFLAVDGGLAGLIVVSDPIKESAIEAVAALRKGGVRVVMLTGDNRRTAEPSRARSASRKFTPTCCPKRKQAIVEQLKREGRRVGMAGDGINDAPALAAADVGIAMGTGTDVAMESAAITLVKGDLAGIVRARRLSRATMRNIRENLFFSFVFNAAGIPLAAGVLYPSLGLLLSPIVAGAAMAFSSVAVIGNSLRLRTERL